MARIAYQRTAQQFANEDYANLSDPVDWTDEDEANVVDRIATASDAEFVACEDEQGYRTYWLTDFS